MFEDIHNNAKRNNFTAFKGDMLCPVNRNIVEDILHINTIYTCVILFGLWIVELWILIFQQKTIEPRKHLEDVALVLHIGPHYPPLETCGPFVPHGWGITTPRRCWSSADRSPISCDACCFGREYSPPFPTCGDRWATEWCGASPALNPSYWASGKAVWYSHRGLVLKPRHGVAVEGSVFSFPSCARWVSPPSEVWAWTASHFSSS